MKNPATKRVYRLYTYPQLAEVLGTTAMKVDYIAIKERLIEVGGYRLRVTSRQIEKIKKQITL